IRVTSDQRKLVQHLRIHRCSERTCFCSEQRRFSSHGNALRDFTECQGDVNGGGLTRLHLHTVALKSFESGLLRFEAVTTTVKECKSVKTGRISRFRPERAGLRIDQFYVHVRDPSPCCVAHDAGQIALVHLSRSNRRKKNGSERKQSHQALLDRRAREYIIET